MKNGKKYCAISVDLDPIDHYLYARDYKPLDVTNLNAIYDDALPRFLDLFDQYGVKVTFFLVGRDVLEAKNKTRIREVVKRGHEIANHTYNHYQYFCHLSHEDKRNEIERTDNIISDTVGKKSVGFRAPAWGIDHITMNILEENEYLYDSSVFPSKLVPVISYVNWLLNKGRLKRGLGNSYKLGMASKLPYFPHREKIWKKGNMNIMEMPPTILPIIQLPFLGTLLFMLGETIFNISFSYYSFFNKPLLYELHGIELVDYYSSINDERLLMKPGLGKKIHEKMKLYHLMLSKFSRSYHFITMQQLVQIFSQNQDP